jgi:APA family basic amino acid/polyamine antiporter
VIGWLLVISGFVFAATVSFGFAGYMEKFFGTPYLLTAVVLVILLSILVFYGVKESVLMGVVFTLIEASGLVIIIALSLPYLGSVNYFDFPSISGVFSAAALIFFAYIGFEQISRLSEETKSPKVNVHRALLLSVAITTILYILVALAAVSILDWRTLGSSNAPLADVASKVMGPNAFTMLSIIALFATSNTVLFMMLATSRMIYGMGKSFSPNNIFARIHSKRRTPWVATIVTMIFSALCLGFGKIEIVAGMTDFLVFFTFIVINLSLIVIRYKKEGEMKDTFRAPLNIGKFPLVPVFGIISCFLLMAYTNFEIIIYSILMIIIGFAVVEILERKGIRAKFE